MINSTKKPTDRKLTSFFIQYAKTHKMRFYFAFILIPISTLLSISGPKLFQLAVDNGILKNDISYTIMISFAYLAIVILHYTCQVTQNISMQTAGIRTLRDMREALMKHISFIGKKHYDQHPTGVYVSRATSDIEAVGETFLHGVTYLINDLLTIFGIFSVMIYINQDLGLITLVLFPIIAALIDIFRRILRKLFDRIRTINGLLTAQINESLAMLYEINNFHLDKVYSKEFADNNTEYMNRSVKSISYDALLFSLLEGFLPICIGLIFIIIATNSNINSNISPGKIIAYIMLLQLMFSPIKEMGSRFAVLQAALAALQKINHTIEIPQVVDEGNKSIHGLNLHLKNIAFSYKKDEHIFTNLNLDIPYGQSLAIVGPTGSGKSTLIKLISRQYEIQNGEILFGEIPIKNISRTDLKEKIVQVPQDPTIFHETIAFNISLNRKNISREKIIEVSKKVKAHDFIENLPDGYDSILTEDGNNLSSGQMQLIALARALASEAEFIIFDEATANIDSVTEILIQEALNYLMTHKTTIIIAHRLSTIRNANNIVVMRKGEIIEQGAHKNLMNKKGFYAKLYNLQQQSN